jgi:hypothetical protein
MPVISENYKMRPRHNWYSKIIRKYYKIRVNLTKPRSPIPDADILEKANKEKQLVIQIPFGGLGDHLVYSSLPELLWKQKRIKTFISNKSIFRSKAIRDFVWGLNPYVEFTDDNGWFIYQPLEHKFPTLDEYLQKLFNLQGNGCPKVYYNPHLIEQIKGKDIVDPSFGPSGKANGYYESDFHKRFVEYLKSNVGEFILIAHKYSKTKNPLEELIMKTFNPNCYSVFTIEELADVLFSVGKRYLLYSGVASLSAALALPSIVLCNRKAAPNFQYKSNEHIDLIEGNSNQQMERA